MCICTTWAIRIYSTAAIEVVVMESMAKRTTLRIIKKRFVIGVPSLEDDQTSIYASRMICSKTQLYERIYGKTYFERTILKLIKNTTNLVHRLQTGTEILNRNIRG